MKKNTKKRIGISLACVMAMTSLLGGVMTARADETKELTLAIWGDEDRAARYEETLAPFCEANGCTVDIELVPISDFYDKLATQLPQGTAPDVFWMADAKEVPFIEAGWTANLKDVLEADESYDLGDFYEDAIYSTDYDGDGDIYGVPFSFGARQLYYNLDLFKEAGVKTPRECMADGTWTYDTMFDLASQIAAYDSTKIGIKLWCRGEATNGVQMFADLLPAYGANLVNEDSTEFTLDSEEGIATIQKVYDAMYTNGGSAMPGDDTDFISGNIAMSREPYSYMTFLTDDIGFEYDIVPLPEGPMGTDAPLFTGYAYWCVNAESEEIDLAKELVKFVTNPENQLAWCKTFMVPRTSVMNSDAILNLGEGYPDAEVIKEAFVDTVAAHGLYTYRGTPDWTQVQNAVEQYYELIWAGSYSVADGIAAMKAEVEQYLN